MSYEYRNAKKFKTGTYECEINHPEYGWIPFHATSYDTDEKGIELFNALEKDNTIPLESEEEHLEKQSILVRHKRNGKLVHDVDPIASNTLRFNSLDAEKQKQLKEYRQALLDIPTQNGFPLNVEFPVKPEWI